MVRRLQQHHDRLTGSKAPPGTPAKRCRLGHRHPLQAGSSAGCPYLTDSQSEAATTPAATTIIVKTQAATTTIVRTPAATTTTVRTPAATTSTTPICQQGPRPPPRQRSPQKQPQGNARQSQRPACLWCGRRGHTEADCRCKLLYQQSSPAKSQQKSAAIHSQTSRPVSTPNLTDPLPFSAVYQVTTRIPPEIAVAHQAACLRQSPNTDSAARDNTTADPTPVHAAETTGPQHPVPRRPTPAPRKLRQTQDPATQQVIPTGPTRPVIPRQQRRTRRHRPPAVTPSPVSSAITSVPLSDTDIDTDTDSGIGLWKPYRSSRHKQCKTARDIGARKHEHCGAPQSLEVRPLPDPPWPAPRSIFKGICHKTRKTVEEQGQCL